MSNSSPAVPPLPTAQIISTRHAPAGRELEYWCDHLFDKVIPAKFKVANQGRFHGEIAITPVGELVLNDVQASPFMIERSAATIRAQPSASSALCLVMAGSAEITSGSQRVPLRCGTGAIFNADSPGIFVNHENVRLLQLSIPHAMITGGTAALQRVTGQDLTQSGTLFALVRGYLAQLAECGASLDASAGGRVGRNLADLVNAMVAEVAQQAPPRLSQYRAASLMRVRIFVEEHLAVPELSPRMVSQALHLSPRYINQLLEAEGTSLRRLIWRLRLERVARDLGDPNQAMYSISALALAWGFNHITHFNKVFRQRYAMSPREYRSLRGTEADKISTSPRFQS